MDGIENEAIAIIGSACRFPGNASSSSKLWEVLCAPKDLCSPLPASRFNAAGFYHSSAAYHGHSNVHNMKSYFLSEDAIERQFDAAFFGISPAEANVLDPQVRLLLETTYEALEAAGQTMESLQGSDTGCYVGLMMGEYEVSMLRDPEAIGTYHITGTARSLLSNRLSYFFDWHGPSMTIDTACSSSLVAVHQAVQLLRLHQAKLAVAAGANLILDPITHVSESKLRMLSPDGRGRMWDAAANGYARGEGVATLVLKRLRDAISDGDHVECIIRETGINQDGKTRGITMPSSEAQATLIRETYRKAGLDPANARDRPQYFEAHGTGTPAGDPVEAEAIHCAFFGDQPQTGEHANDHQPLLVGSVKTVLGHSEGTAGIAAILKASLALQQATVPPNLLLENLNPRIKPFTARLRVPKSLVPWPAVEAGQPRRASVNSFGFGGANAILESFECPITTDMNGNELTVFTPFVFSAASEKSLRSYLKSFAMWLDANSLSLNLRSIARTLYSRRTRLQYSTAIAALDTAELIGKLQAKVESQSAGPEDPFSVRSQPDKERGPVILGIFTGQGAQWPAMGADLLSKSSAATDIVSALERRLARLPIQDRPQWSLLEEMRRHDGSRVAEATLSQPICTAVQIVLVDLLRSSGVEFSAVVGHSSGEIAAAYAAGIISAEDAICIGYYRGLHGRLAAGRNGQKGAMMAAGITSDDASELIDSHVFKGRAVIAAYNSSTSLTLSGDEDAIDELKTILDDEQKFARLLIVEKAYHSHHMEPCAGPYGDSLKALDLHPAHKPNCLWISSVSGNDIVDYGLEKLSGDYWVENAASPVLFMQAVQRACELLGTSEINLAIEIGPHPALQGPTTQTIRETTGQAIPYTGLLKRKLSGIVSLAEGLGFVWSHLPKAYVNLQAFDHFVSGNAPAGFVPGLPTYSWDHDAVYWHQSRHAKEALFRSKPHELLGHLTSDLGVRQELTWRQILNPAEIPWLNGHRLQNQSVLPAAAYVILAIEACRELHKLSPDLDSESTRLIHVQNLVIYQAMTFDNDDSRIEAVFKLHDISRGPDAVSANFKYFGGPADATRGEAGSGGSTLRMLASGSVEMIRGKPSHQALPPRGPRLDNMLPVNADDFYKSLRLIGYEYSGPFRTLSGLRRRLGAVSGCLSHQAESDNDSGLLVHPGMLDVAFQAVLLAKAAPYDGTLWSMHVPKTIKRVTVNPSACETYITGKNNLSFDSCQSTVWDHTFRGDVDVYPPEAIGDSKSVGVPHAIIQVEGLDCVPFSRATAENDREPMSVMVWDLAFPNAEVAAHDLSSQPGPQELEMAHFLERLSFFYLQRLQRLVPNDHPCRRDGMPLCRLFDFARHIETRVVSGKLPFWENVWLKDTPEVIKDASSPYTSEIDCRILDRIGENLVDIATGHTTAIEITRSDDILSEYYSSSMIMGRHNTFLARTVKQIAHRYPHLNILEVGSGTGVATKEVLKAIGDSFSSYAFTDISSGFFPAAQAYFSSSSTFPRMSFSLLDISSNPQEQGFELHAYDVIIASMVLHATPVLRQSLRNVRQLLKPGGYLIIVEVIDNNVARLGAVFGAFPGWWLGAENDGRTLGPALPPAKWDELLRDTGFSGCDSSVPVIDPLFTPSTVLVSQAVDARVSFLREPLSASSQSSASRLGLDSAMQEVVLIGGDSTITSQLIRELKGVLHAYFGSVRHISSLGDIGTCDVQVTQTTTLVSLSDVDAPFCRDVKQTSLKSMKDVLHSAGSILWVTQGRRAENAFANMMVGLVRSVLLEVPTLAFQFLDFEDASALEASLIAQALLRFKAGLAWRQERNGQGRKSAMLMTVERELVVDKRGQVLIPRMYPAKDMNERYNSGLRPIFGRRPLKEGGDTRNSLILKRDEDHGEYVLEEMKDQAHPDSLQATHSLLSACWIKDFGHAHINLVRDKDDSPQLLLSSRLASALRPLPNLPPAPICPRGKFLKDPASAGGFLVLFALNMLAMSLVVDIPRGERLVVFEPEPAFATILKAATEDRGVDMTIITSTMSHQRCEFLGWLLIHPQAPARDIRNALPKRASIFLVCSGDAKQADASNVTARIIATLPSLCRTVYLSELYGQEALCRSIHDEKLHDLHSRLRTAIFRAQEGHASQEVRTVSPKQISEITANRDATRLDMAKQSTVIDWEKDTEVSVRIRPIDDQTLFSGSKTYWLAGLSSSLGLSLCEWMISRGAQYIVISSRKPNVSGSWLDKMSSLGAVVKILSNDLTDFTQTESLYQDICSIMPPVAGVAQGAMVLCDSSFRNMTLEDWQTACRAKVQGTIHLDKLLHDVDLDFFICFSSVTAVAGNPGQSNYSAANLFMTSIAEQRRRRGLAASVIHIAPLLGVGYLSEKMELAKTNFSRTSGYSLHAERDFHQQFAEAVVAGRARHAGPDPPHDPPTLPRPLEVAMGLQKVSPDPEKLPFWFDNPTMSHFISHGDVRQTSTAVQRKESVKSLLSSAETWDRVHEVLKDALKSFICSLFQIQGGDELDDARFLGTSLDEIGLDSLLAVEVRTWWLKTVGVSLPVMKILSGITVGQLMQFGMEGLSPNVVPSIKTGDGDGPGQTKLLPLHRIDTLNSSEGREESTDTATSDTTDTTGTNSPIIPITAIPADKVPDNSASYKYSVPTSLEMNDEDKAAVPEPPPVVERWTELSPSQKMFWFILTFLDDKAGLNHTGMYRLTGPVRVSNLEKAFLALGQRHESLRTCFQSFDGWHPRQGVMETSRVYLEYRQISDAREATLALEELREHRYNLESGECLRAILLQQSPTVQYLVLGTHTLVLDGFSIYVLMQDLARLYIDGSTLSSGPDSSTICQYPAFVAAQLEALNAGDFESDLRFWSEEFTPCPTPMPPLTVSSASHHPVQSKYENHISHLHLDGATKSSVQDLCRRYKTRPFHFFLTVFRALLSRFADMDEIAIGIGDANRTHEGALEGLGQYFNLLPLRFSNDSEQRFDTALRDTKDKTDLALSHSRVPFQVLLERLGVHRSPTHTPIFQSFFDYRQSLRERQPFGDCELELLNFDGARTPYDIALEIIDDHNHDEYRLMLIVRADMYSEHDAGLLATSYQKLVRAFTSTPDILFADPGIFEPQEVERALDCGRDEAVPSQWNGESFVNRIQGLAASNPKQLACKLPHGGKSMTYGEMMGKSRAIANALTTSGCTIGSVVALYQEPTPEWLCSLIAIFSIGAVCVPFDAGTLVQRLAVMAEDSNVSVVLTDNLIDSQNFVKLSSHDSRKIINVEQISSLHAQEQTTVPSLSPSAPRAEDPALILYTSGSTGVPKGTVLRYGGLSNWAEFVAPVYFTDEGPGTVLQQTSIGFDIAYLQVLVALCYGGTLCIVPRAKRVDPSAITDIIATEGVNMTAGVPSELMNWLHYGDRAALSQSTQWRTICMGGEAVAITLLELQALLGPKPSPRFFHIYGPTETTITATSAELFYGRDTTEPLSVGRAFPNYSVYVLDDQLRPVPLGVQGEVCFGGAGVAAGYLRNATLTAERFVDDPFAPKSFRTLGWSTMHRTGDKGRWRKDGSGLQIEGRRTGDTQHKLRGFRIDLQEIEKVMLKEAGGLLSQVVVTVRRSGPDSPEFLVAHAQFHPQHCPEDLRDQQLFLNTLSSRLPLPQYMVPAITFPLRDLPVTSSGKLNRRALAAFPLPETTIFSDHYVDGTEGIDTHLTETEEWLKRTWKKIIPENVVSSHHIGTDTDFFHVGGTSMLLLRLQAENRQKFGFQVPLVEMFANSRLGSMARLIDQRAEAESRLAPTVDWDAETELCPETQAALSIIAAHHEAKVPPGVVVLTGATGLLGRGFVKRLIADPNIRRIHCVAVRHVKTRAPSLPPELKNDKVVLYEGDLRLPRLGLSEVETRTIFGSADRIIHNGADTSHLQTYQSLRSANLQSTKEIVKMALLAGRRVPIHYISTASVLQYSGLDEFGEESASVYPPPPNAFDGYSASKWASEAYLSKVHESQSLGSGWPIWIHRPTVILRDESDGDDDGGEIIPTLLKYCKLINAVPLMPNIRGFINLVPLGHVVESLSCEMSANLPQQPQLRFLHETGDVDIPVSDLKSYIDVQTGKSAAQLSPDEFARKAAQAGMDEVLVAFFESLHSMPASTWPRLIRNKNSP